MQKRFSLLMALAGCIVAGSAFADWDRNPSFEQPFGTGLNQTWRAYPVTNATTIGRSTTEAYNGTTWSLQFVTEDIAGDILDFPLNDERFRYTVVDQLFNAAPAVGTEWTVSTHYYLPQELKDGENLGVGIFWYQDIGGALIPSSINWGSFYSLATASGGVGAPAITNAWTEITHTETVPADAAYMMIALEVAGDGSTFYFDGVDVIPEPSTLLLFGMGLGVFVLARRRRVGTAGIACLVTVFALQLSMTTAQAESTHLQISDELAAAIAEIEADSPDMEERMHRIALLIARTTRSNPLGSAPVLADLSRRISATDLPIVSAAAIMSAGTSSPAVLKAMVEAQQEDTARIQAIRESASRPASVLGTRTAALIQPVEIALLPRPAVESADLVVPPVITVAEAPVAPVTITPEPASAPVVAPVTVDLAPTIPTPAPSDDTEAPLALQPTSQPPPLQPFALPPRPPAIPYRGQ